MVGDLDDDDEHVQSVPPLHIPAMQQTLFTKMTLLSYTGFSQGVCRDADPGKHIGRPLGSVERTWEV